MSTKSVKVSEILKELRGKGACRISEPIPLNHDLDIKIPGKELEGLIHVFKQLSDPTRLKILSLLYLNGSLPVCIISYVLGLDQTLVSHHLKTLLKAGLVQYKRTGKYKMYSLTSLSEKVFTVFPNILSTREERNQV
ncbi:winged helix-turn-helix transcriptional regulator [Thermosphaera chiliense]|uniref:Winged helix-turn-helix transcriptional regulator n=1 Tax=Thermosphaera chiliense TaxID=3402707 RepID=A0A7M1UR83_9CREN|nr:metalloregulator ArsR/SmtB family transcription factor [Thermosphaera aggregans]QOR94770.1 winged helix-turn-helix transcriptional regulator [Thermosphaera aggregans]